MSNKTAGLILGGCVLAIIFGFGCLARYQYEKRDAPRRELAKEMEEYVRDRRHYIVYLSLKVCMPSLTTEWQAHYKQSFIILKGEERAVGPLEVSTYEALEDLYDRAIDNSGGKISDELRFIRKAAKECRRLEEFTKRVSESSRYDIHYDRGYFRGQQKEIENCLADATK